MLIDGPKMRMVGGLPSIVGYCAITEAVLGAAIQGGVISQNADFALQQYVRAYVEAGDGAESISRRAPLVIWLVMCGWTTPQRVLEVMAGQNAGHLDEQDLHALFKDRWILESLLEHWKADGVQQREYLLTAARFAGKNHHESKMRQLMHSKGGLIESINNAGERESYSVDAFTAQATAWSQRVGHITRQNVMQLTNEPALLAMLSRPQIFTPPEEESDSYNARSLIAQRWHDLVKEVFGTTVRNSAGPVTARLIFEGISKGLDYFEQERRR